MDGFSTYKYYLALKFHFTVSGYDVFKHRGRTRANRMMYESKPGVKIRMEVLGKRFNAPDDAIKFFLACNLYNVDVFNDVDSNDAYLRWKKRSEMMTQFILDELESIKELSSRYIAKQVSGGFISYETAVAIARCMDILSEIDEDIIYRKISDKMKKLDKFIKYDENRVEAFIQEKYGQAA